jgi:hypothetical protein
MYHVCDYHATYCCTHSITNSCTHIDMWHVTRTWDPIYFFVSVHHGDCWVRWVPCGQPARDSQVREMLAWVREMLGWVREMLGWVREMLGWVREMLGWGMLRYADVC